MLYFRVDWLDANFFCIGSRLKFSPSAKVNIARQKVLHVISGTFDKVSICDVKRTNNSYKLAYFSIHHLSLQGWFVS